MWYNGKKIELIKMMSAVNTNSLMTPKKFSMSIEKLVKDSERVILMLC